jgi:hypothetical protein
VVLKKGLAIRKTSWGKLLLGIEEESDADHRQNLMRVVAVIVLLKSEAVRRPCSQRVAAVTL